MRQKWPHKLHGLRREVMFADAIALEPIAESARAWARELILNPSHQLVESFCDEFTKRWNLPIATISSQQIELTFPLSLFSDVLPCPPHSYAWKGSAARYAVGKLIEGEFLPPRDLDLLRIGRHWQDLDTEVSQEFMKEDWERGYGVELRANLQEYFDTRDLCVNECALFANRLLVTPLALLDIVGRVIRPCRYRPGSLSRPPSLRSLTFLKMLRLRAEQEYLGQAWTLVGLAEGKGMEPLHIAVHLRKALQQHEKVAELFVEQLALLGIVPAYPEEQLWRCIAELSHYLFEGVAFFNILTEEQALKARRYVEESEA